MEEFVYIVTGIIGLIYIGHILTQLIEKEKKD